MEELRMFYSNTKALPKSHHCSPGNNEHPGDSKGVCHSLDKAQDTHKIPHQVVVQVLSSTKHGTHS